MGEKSGVKFYMENTQNPSGRNLKEAAQLPMQNIPIPETSRSLGQQAFESQVQPFRRGFQERLETTTGELSRRGIAFGGATGPGSTQVRKLIESEQQYESDIAKSIGSQFGMTLLDQAFQSSEAAKRFEESKEFAAHTQGLTYGRDSEGRPLTQLEAQKQLSEFGAKLDIDTQRQLGELNLSNQKALFEYTSELEADQKKDFANFMTNLDSESRKDFLTFSTNLDVQSKKDVAQFMSNLDSESQKDMATFLSSLEADQAKDLASFTANLDIATQKELSNFAQSLRGGLNDDGLPLNDVEIAEKMSEVSNNAQRTLSEMSRGVNPETGQPYTDFDMANISANLEINRARRQSDINKDLAEFGAILERGADAEGNPLDAIAFQELAFRSQQKLQAEASAKAFEQAAIAEYGANGVQIANDLAETRGASIIQDFSMLEAIESDNGLTISEKQELTDLIINGAGWESEPVVNILNNSNSQVVAKDFLSMPDPAESLRGASSELKDYLAQKGFDYERKSERGFLGIETNAWWDMDLDENATNRFNELWNTDPEFRRMVKKG